MMRRLAAICLAAALIAPAAAFAQRIVSLLETTAAPVVVDPATHRAYVAMKDSSLVALDAAQRVSGVGLSATPYWMTLDSAHQRLYMLNSYDGLTILNLATLRAVATVQGLAGTGVVNERTQRLYVMTPGGPDGVVLDAATGGSVGSFSLAAGACSMALNENTNQLYVAHCAEKTSGASVVDLDTMAVTFIPIPQPLPAMVAVNPATNRAYVIDNDGGTIVTVIEGATKQYRYLQTGATPTGKPSWIAVNPSTNRIYAVFGTQFLVIDGATEAVVARAQLDGSVNGLEVDPAMNRVYALVDQDMLVALDASSAAIISTLQLPVRETSMDLDVATHRLYTAGAGGLLIDTTAPPGPRMYNYQGLWWNPNESGWGVNIAQQGDVWFAAWYTYDRSGKPTWFVMPRGARTSGEAFSGALYRVTAGSSFQSDPFDSASVVATQVGTLEFSFDGRNDGAMVATVNGIRIAKSITREQLAAPGLLCETGTGANAQNATDLWWRWPAASESGWGLFVTQQANTAFGVWFTYDASGQPTWFAATMARNPNLGSMVELNGDMYQTSGPAYDAPSWDASKVQPVRVGTMKVAATGVDQAVLTFTAGSVSGLRPLTRERFGVLATACF